MKTMANQLTPEVLSNQDLIALYLTAKTNIKAIKDEVEKREKAARQLLDMLSVGSNNLVTAPTLPQYGIVTKCILIRGIAHTKDERKALLAKMYDELVKRSPQGDICVHTSDYCLFSIIATSNDFKEVIEKYSNWGLFMADVSDGYLPPHRGGQLTVYFTGSKTAGSSPLDAVNDYFKKQSKFYVSIASLQEEDR